MARGKPVYASTVREYTVDSSKETYSPDYAIDGQFTKMFKTEETGHSWLVVELLQFYIIESVVLIMTELSDSRKCAPFMNED